MVMLGGEFNKVLINHIVVVDREGGFGGRGGLLKYSVFLFLVHILSHDGGVVLDGFADPFVTSLVECRLVVVRGKGLDGMWGEEEQCGDCDGWPTGEV